MREKLTSQEGLKIIACATMLIDHVGAVLFPGIRLPRVIGRISFPIFCFLLVEGVAHSRDLKKYGIRLLIGAVLSEIVFDLTFYGKLTLGRQSVMITLFLGFLMVACAFRKGWFVLPMAGCYLAARFLNCDYGGWGIAVVAVFMLARGYDRKLLPQILGLAVAFWYMNSYRISVGPVRIPIQMFGLLSLVPIYFYSGRKLSRSKALQWAFYLFYPAHMLVLLILKRFS